VTHIAAGAAFALGPASIKVPAAMAKAKAANFFIFPPDRCCC